MNKQVCNFKCDQTTKTKLTELVTLREMSAILAIPAVPLPVPCNLTACSLCVLAAVQDARPARGGSGHSQLATAASFLDKLRHLIVMASLERLKSAAPVRTPCLRSRPATATLTGSQTADIYAAFRYVILIFRWIAN